MTIWELETPSLLIDQDILMSNLKNMQSYADRKHVALRPHTKTHKMPYVARLQMDMGAIGIAVAKVGEAEVMAQHGLDNIMIANEIVGEKKLARIAMLSKTCRIQYGVDSVYQILEAERVFSTFSTTANVVVEIEVGENRSGIMEDHDFMEILKAVQSSPHVAYKGVFGHDGNSYRAKDISECQKISMEAQRKLLHFAFLAEEAGLESEIVSYGSTPSVLCDCDILDGITDLRIGTYALMDASQAHAIGNFESCAAAVLATVISKPTSERVILDVGAKGLTMQERQVGICTSEGKGRILEDTDVRIASVFDEHAIINNPAFREKVELGEKVRIIPAHICPVVNLYDTVYFYSGETVIKEVPVLGRGKMQ